MRCFSSAGSPLQAYGFSLGYPSIHDSPFQPTCLEHVGLDRLLCAHTSRAHTLPIARSESHLWRGGFPHSDICGSKLVCQLPAAFRRLPRPSSPVIAKASTTCTSSLDPISRESWLVRTHQDTRPLGVFAPPIHAPFVSRG